MAEAGNVTTQAKTMSRTVVHRTLFKPLSRPMPMIAKLLTCVVETGSPNVPESKTSEDVVRLADNPSV
jgi:hypothetical protein